MGKIVVVNKKLRKLNGESRKPYQRVGGRKSKKMESQEERKKMIRLLSCTDEFEMLERQARNTFLFYAIVALVGLGVLLFA